MKLLTKTTLYFITVTLFIFFFGGIAFYKVVQKSIKKNVDEQLLSHMHQLKAELKNNHISPKSSFIVPNSLLDFKAVKKATPPAVSYSDTILYNKYSAEYEPYRQVRFYISSQDQIYRVSIYKSLIEANALIEKVALGLTILVLLLLVAILIVNRFFFQKIWSNFFDTIKKIENYDLNSKKAIRFSETEIIEFKKLNAVLSKMTDRIQKDYTDLKEFTENLSHEIQTPLAVVRSKIELLMQNPNLREEDMELVHTIYSQIINLSKLNKSLIMITKIENNQFDEKKNLRIDQKIHDHLENFQEVMNGKNLTCTSSIKHPIEVRMNENLADILLGNLIKNSIKHNIPNGEIKVHSDQNALTISNTGKPTKQTENQIFERYNTKNTRSTGLGLTIVKKICELYEFNIEYYQNGDTHSIKVNFK